MCLFGTNPKLFKLEKEDNKLIYYRKQIVSNIAIASNSIAEIKKDEAQLRFEFLRKTGFPNYQMTSEEKLDVFNQLVSCKHGYIKDKVLTPNNKGLSLLWTYFPHAWEISCSGRKSPMEVFSDASSLKEILKELFSQNNTVSQSAILSKLKSFKGAQAVSNFRPLSAKAIYDLFAGDGIVYDMCAGFGGRMLGAILSPRVKKYIGTDPSTKTYQGLLKLKKELGFDKDIEIFPHCAEDFILPENYLDLCFTSPPYFNCEKYSYESSQSFMRHSTRDRWISGFMESMLKNCFFALKNTGYLVINIANVSSYPNLEEDFLLVAKLVGFELIDTYQYAMSAFGTKSFKTEPIFVFKKKV